MTSPHLRRSTQTHARSGTESMRTIAAHDGQEATHSTILEKTIEKPDRWQRRWTFPSLHCQHQGHSLHGEKSKRKRNTNYRTMTTRRAAVTIMEEKIDLIFHDVLPNASWRISFSDGAHIQTRTWELNQCEQSQRTTAKTRLTSLRRSTHTRVALRCVVAMILADCILDFAMSIWWFLSSGCLGTDRGNFPSIPPKLVISTAWQPSIAGRSHLHRIQGKGIRMRKTGNVDAPLF